GPARRILDGGDQPALSRDGRHLLFRRLDGERTSIWIADANGASPTKLLDGGAGELKGARFSPDGKEIAFFWTEAYPGALGDVWKMPVAGGKPIRLTSDRRDVWGHVDFMPDGAEVLYSAVRTGIENIWMVPWKGGTPRPVAAGSFSVISPSVSPDGRSLLVQSQRLTSDAWEYDLAGGTPRPLTRAGTVWAPFRLADGRFVYGDWARQEEEVDLFLEGASGARTYLAGGSNPRPTADGRTIVFSTALGEGRRGIASVDVEGGPARRLTETANLDEYPDPTPDGKRVVFCRTVKGGKSSVELLEIGRPGTTTLFSGDAMSTRAAEKEAVFRSCTPAGGCGVYCVPLAGGAPRLVVPDGRWPALSRDRRTVYVVVGPKAHPALMRAPLDGSEPPRHVLDFDAPHDPSFWAIFTLDVADDAGKVVVTRQRVDDDIALFEGVFR
ncbi:MAG TPA: hypothetical protein VGR00_02790, partial [Thermoanaerobaculia bacterium]|nr:hypothetical protein [Thermoanaerobaculia bacterium]